MQIINSRFALAVGKTTALCEAVIQLFYCFYWCVCLGWFYIEREDQSSGC